MNEIEALKKAIQKCNKIVIFSGAGLSTNSGIPDFRSANGLYSEKYGNISPEEIISHSFFMANPKEFYKFYFDKMVYLNAKPNICHKYFAKLGVKIKPSACKGDRGLQPLGSIRNIRPSNRRRKRDRLQNKRYGIFCRQSRSA